MNLHTAHLNLRMSVYVEIVGFVGFECEARECPFSITREFDFLSIYHEVRDFLSIYHEVRDFLSIYHEVRDSSSRFFNLSRSSRFSFFQFITKFEIFFQFITKFESFFIYHEVRDFLSIYRSRFSFNLSRSSRFSFNLSRSSDFLSIYTKFEIFSNTNEIFFNCHEVRHSIDHEHEIFFQFITKNFLSIYHEVRDFLSTSQTPMWSFFIVTDSTLIHITTESLKHLHSNTNTQTPTLKHQHSNTNTQTPTHKHQHTNTNASNTNRYKWQIEEYDQHNNRTMQSRRPLILLKMQLWMHRKQRVRYIFSFHVLASLYILIFREPF